MYLSLHLFPTLYHNPHLTGSLPGVVEQRLIGPGRNSLHGAEWRGELCAIKQAEACAVQESPDWLVITVITRYF